ncbi:Rha family transcriptional regulator [Aliivibrio fischeri]|uniref:Rha family transcriptional regulator n=1 Tax=Aliivibrio fischeri TaxID=668 RepID=UPI0012D9EA3E|nr:Rha family transcriptional regulator [Aliivibrio fischeri]MUK91539.1 Rha family transcriptional regulator [Aliivibrio fischeri]
MATIAIVPPAPFWTKKKFSEQTGESMSSIENNIKSGKYPTLPKEAGKGLVRINIVKMFENSALQQV